MRSADVELPHWWIAAANGDFGPLDAFLSAIELHPHQLAGYKDLREISCIAPEIFDPEVKSGLNKFHKRVRQSIRLRASQKKNILPDNGSQCESPLFSQEVLQCLLSFGKEQFIFQDGKSWPPVEKGFLDLYSGKKGFARAAVRYGAPWVLTVDFLDGPQCEKSLRATRIPSGFARSSKSAYSWLSFLGRKSGFFIFVATKGMAKFTGGYGESFL